MVFSSITFILYFLPLFLVAYHIAPKKIKNVVLLVFSVVFYSWGAPKFIFVILGTTFIDFHLVKRMNKTLQKRKKNQLLLLSVFINLGLLFYFKYSNFFIDNFNVILTAFGGNSILWSKLILPIGISFYTFESITYSVDVYRGVHKPLHKFWDYQLYIILFPKLIAGPIVRYHDIAGQLENRFSKETIDNFLVGCYRFIVGLAKKVIIANQMGLQADLIMSEDIGNLSTPQAWIGILAYTFQIYFDFSGYSDMAIGLCKMVGFSIPENFNSPYISKSITEFWRRWHISLGRWMKDYLYIPLGGNRSTANWKTYRNLFLVFLASGLWHGASWGFVIWGVYHGLFIVLERIFLSRFYKKIGAIPSVIINFLIVVVGWVFFRLEELNKSITYIHQMFSFSNMDFPILENSWVFFFCAAFLFSFFSLSGFGQKLSDSFYRKSYGVRKHLVTTIACFVLLLYCIASISAFEFNPFIYFRF